MALKLSRNLKFFWGAFFLSLPIFWGINIFQENIDNFLFKSQMADNSRTFTAQIVPQQNPPVKKPVRNWQIDILKIEAKSTISVFVDSEKNQQILFESGNNEELPIASLTKLMAALIVWKNYDLSQIVEISQKAVNEEGNSGNFKAGETFTAKNLIYSLLIESSNDAAAALTEVIGKDAFLDLMNLKAKDMGMENTNFVNSTGLEPEKPDGPINRSTARDLVRLAVYLLKFNPEILEISSLPEYDLYNSNGIFHHKVINTDGLLGEFSDILASKTGWTPQAEGCLLLVNKAPNGNGVVINVILGSPDRFGEMKKLIDWIGAAYQW